MSDTTKTLNTNVDLTVTTRTGITRKPLKVRTIESGFFDFFFEPTFGSSIYHAFLNSYSSIFEWKGLPKTKDLNSFNLEWKLNQGGRIKFIKVGSTFLVVNITPQKWNHYGDITESLIIEPWLPKLQGKKTEIFKNVEIRNNTAGHSLIRQIFPFLNDIDDTWDNLNTHGRVLTGKILISGLGNVVDKDNNIVEESINQWLINGKPAKYIPTEWIKVNKIEINPLQFQDSTESFIRVLKYNMSNMFKILGIPSNDNEDKKERLITSEVSVQNVLQSSIIDNMLDVRRLAAIKINKEFGLNISVDIKEEFKEEIAANKKSNIDNNANPNPEDNKGVDTNAS